LHYVGALKPIENFFRTIIDPGSSIIYKWSVEFEEGREEFDSVNELETAYIEIKNKYSQLIVDKTEFELLKEDNKELREQLNFFEGTNYNSIGAFVVGKSIEPLRNSITIDKGEKDNIKVGCPVIVGNGIFVGKIARVEKENSIVQLVNDQQSKVAVTVLNGDKSIGIIEGGYGLSIQMNFIPQNESINTGDTIITSGLEEKIPKGLVVGTIDVVEKEAYQPFQKAMITPVINLDKISIVSVLIDEGVEI
jgi:rod shape-determining protein MreC